MKSVKEANKTIFVLKQLSSAGWYKFAKINGMSVAAANNSYGTVCEYKIGRGYSNNNNEVYHISEASGYYKSVYTMISKSINVQLITKIRQVYYPDTKEKYYELYYSGDKANQVYVSFSLYPYLMHEIALEPDTGNPSVVSEYTIPA